MAEVGRAVTRVSPWWMGVTVDHLYEQCPARTVSLGTLKRYGWNRVGRGEVDTDGGDLCGTCLRWWRARNRA